MDKLDFAILKQDYSKVLSECSSGTITANKSQRQLLLNAPEFSEKESKLFSKILEELKHSERQITTKAEVYFF